MSWAGNTNTQAIGSDDSAIVIEGKPFVRAGKHWSQSDGDAILTANKKWLVLQSIDGRIVNRTLFGEGPGLPVAGRIHVDVHEMQTGKRRISLEIDQTEHQGFSSFVNSTRIYDDHYLLLRVDPRGKQIHYLVCKLPIEQ